MGIVHQDLLTPLEDFEIKHKIIKTREDVLLKFLGACPSRYYKFVDMNIKRLRKEVSRLYDKLYPKN